jgi:hypothetical protein
MSKPDDKQKLRKAYAKLKITTIEEVLFHIPAGDDDFDADTRAIHLAKVQFDLGNDSEIDVLEIDWAE